MCCVVRVRTVSVTYQLSFGWVDPENNQKTLEIETDFRLDWIKSTSLTDKDPASFPSIVFEYFSDKEIKYIVGKRSQSLARKISHVWREYNRAW